MILKKFIPILNPNFMHLLLVLSAVHVHLSVSLLCHFLLLCPFMLCLFYSVTLSCASLSLIALFSLLHCFFLLRCFATLLSPIASFNAVVLLSLVCYFFSFYSFVFLFIYLVVRRVTRPSRFGLATNRPDSQNDSGEAMTQLSQLLTHSSQERLGRVKAVSWISVLHLLDPLQVGLKKKKEN